MSAIPGCYREVRLLMPADDALMYQAAHEALRVRARSTGHEAVVQASHEEFLRYLLHRGLASLVAETTDGTLGG